MNNAIFTRIAHLIKICALIFLFSTTAHAYCTGSTTTSAFSPPLVKINKNTEVGQVVSSATVNLYVKCMPAGKWVDSTRWVLTYTPKYPLVATSISQGVFATNMPGLGFRLYSNTGSIIKPTWYGTNGGDNFGTGCFGASPSCGVGLTSTNNFTFRIELVRTDTDLKLGAFSDSIIYFGYQDGYTGDCPEANCISVFGQQTTTPVNFEFTAPQCTISMDSKNLAVKLPTIWNAELKAIGATAGDTSFNLNLNSCVYATGVAMTIDGATDGLDSVLKNTGSADGVGVQLLMNGTPLRMNSVINAGNAGNTDQLSIPLVARYYKTKPAVTAGNTAAVATITLVYN